MSSTPTSEMGDTLEPDQNPQTTEESESFDQEWKPALEYSWKEERWLNDESRELFIE